MILAEGAVIFVVEDAGHALSRNAEILAVIKGYGNSFDTAATRSFNGAGKGLENAIFTALQDASLSPLDIDYVASCANSTRHLDRIETQVAKKIFGSRAHMIPMSSIKSMIGESFSASGALAFAAAVGTLRNEAIPPTVNYMEKDPDCDLDYVPNNARNYRSHNVLVLSADPQGNNTAIVLGRYDR